jgi:hypothetical protein
MHNANEKQVGGTHYATGNVQHWDYVQEALNGAYLMGNVTKYVARHRKKNGLQDLEKAKHYLQKIMELYQTGALSPPRRVGDASVPAVVGQFIHHGGLTYWEGRVMVLACVWSSLNELHEIRDQIHQMMDACEAQKRMDEERSAAEPGAGYVDQDRYEINPFAEGELEQFVCWLSVQSPNVVFGSSIETPKQLEVLRRYEALTKCEAKFSNAENFGGVPLDNQPSKRLDVPLPTVREVNPLTASRSRKFKLVRDDDETGISGTGVVAEGIEFSNGMCAMCWLTAMHSVAVYPNARQLEAIHGHNGRAKIVFDA